MIYTIEGTFVELSQAEASSSQIPYVDATNKYLPSTYIHGELRLSMINGPSAPVGTEVPAETTAGKFPLYNITLTQGQSNYKVQLHANAPRGRLTSRTVPVTPLATNSATLGFLNDMSVYSMTKSGTQGVCIGSAMHENQINPYLPIRLKITFSPEIVGGNVSFRMRYKALAGGESTGVATTNSVIEVVPVVTVADGIQAYTLQVSIPTNEFASFVANKWVVSKEHLKIVLERHSADPDDTNAGAIRILSATLTQ